MTRPKLNTFGWEDFEELANERPQRWLWDGILPAFGVVLLVGPAFVGKTSLVAMLAAAMLKTATLAGRAVTEGKMILTAVEHLPSDLWKTMVAAARGAGAQKPENVIFLRGFDLDDDEQVEALARVAQRTAAAVIVIDPIRRVTRLDENNSADVSGMHRQLQKLGPEKRLIIVVHHFGRNREVRGSTDFEAGVDTVVRLSGKNDRLLVHAVHHGAPEVQLALDINRTEDSIAAVETVDDRLDEVTEAVLQILPTQGGGGAGLGVRDVRKAMRDKKLSFRNDQIDAALKDLERRHMAKNEGGKGKHAWVGLAAPGRPNSSDSTSVGGEPEAGVPGPCHP